VRLAAPPEENETLSAPTDARGAVAETFLHASFLKGKRRSIFPSYRQIMLVSYGSRCSTTVRAQNRTTRARAAASARSRGSRGRPASARAACAYLHGDHAYPCDGLHGQLDERPGDVVCVDARVALQVRLVSVARRVLPPADGGVVVMRACVRARATKWRRAHPGTRHKPRRHQGGGQTDRQTDPRGKCTPKWWSPKHHCLEHASMEGPRPRPGEVQV
jgi:hypothetical protein